MHWSYLDTFLLLTVSVHLIRAPYTKVEESFNIQAIHDILEYGILDVSQYDHLNFPGVVPRTFISALVVAAVTKPFVWISSLFGAAPGGIDTQLLVRSTIGMFNVLGFVYLKNALQALMDKDVEKQVEEKGSSSENIYTFSSAGSWFILFIVGSFHLMFYSSRPLPNFIVTLPLVNVALGWVLLGRYRWAIFLLSLTAVIFRSEVGGVTLGVALGALFFKKISFYNTIKFGFMGAVLGMGISLTIDSYFWGVWCVPEVDAFLFNVIGGKAARWGTEPFLAYFTNYLRMLFLPPTVLFLNYLGYKVAPNELKIISLAAYFHIFVMSFQPHKEWRFIVYALPPMFALGATAATYLWENIKVQSLKNVFMLALLPVSAVLSFAFSMLFLNVSSMNYPGGEALVNFNQYVVRNNVSNAVVHISVAPCMTGVTLFGELDLPGYNITYDRSEELDQLQEKWPQFDYLITESSSPSEYESNLGVTSETEWELIQTTQMLTGIDVSYISQYVSNFAEKYGEAQLGSVLLNELKNLPTFALELLSGNTFVDIVKDIYSHTFKKGDVFFTFKKVSK
ncbi:dolichyl-P-Man:Man(7)GlcNAc(2)-PP-dolichol alpha-1,6-mannosyltransferase KNAG_0D00400 [Huiozyma naganishii CBS 8797]|uniref:Mannosyltransferase n=1 Tax=Huiozyma naganishii (strain ATCC MYA-139 / BCRC 22969 / CBS 8797 / KCTC 17520 / NBRC 10181 / NCYC 3082 / Yp74L-3) TaxID=1071383 RepID=J7RJV8_HUIN7|nr:hypothetical protein KNAG_0D00400 [Kazachstania naganishii CBS 8797]CCK69793.1 hypothetical protein KNAG_0D00400 [Kazachstania naganishii CBS 8797]